MKQVIIEREYSDESLYDLETDINWAIEEFEKKLTKNEHGFAKGIFKMTLTYEE
jgi:hypothetical protein